MALGFFITGFTVAEVLAIQGKAKELLLEGKTIMSWNDSGTSVTKELPLTVRETLQECAHALRVLDPDTYGSPKRLAVSSVGTIHL